jgi:NlpC/P60 family putative phage cell wall peptidase
MATRKQIVTEAREWIGTRFHHQGAIKRVGCDCGGLVRGVGIACGIYPPEFMNLPEAEPFRGYRANLMTNQLQDGCDLFATRIEFADAKPGDFVLLRFDGVARHLGILGDSQNGGFTLIHAYIGLRKVVEHQLDKVWTERIMAAYVYPGVE